DKRVKRDSPAFTGFVTAGSKKIIAVSEAALRAAQRRLDAISKEHQPSGSNEENLDPSQESVFRENSVKRVVISSTTARRNSKNPFSTPFRPPDMVKPILTDGPSTSIAAAGSAVSTASSRITCIRDLRSCKSISVNFMGIVISGTSSCSHDVGDAPTIKVILDFMGIVVSGTSSCSHDVGDAPTIKVADRYGDSVSVELQSTSIPPNISRGSVVSIEGALLRSQRGTVSLVLTDTAFVDLEPSDPEAECLHRLYKTGLFDVAENEDSFSFANTSLRLIGRLHEYAREASTVMARICSIDVDKLIYLGCSSCQRHIDPNPKGSVSCQHCHNNKARYFYSLNAELADFSGVFVVKLSDDTAKKLIGRPAAAMLKIKREELLEKLCSLYFRPMLFRISLQNSGWLVDDCKQLDIPKFKPYLRNIAEQKGYR
ncbi:unnamed protein product, partial [Strongylus vulgaris]